MSTTDAYLGAPDDPNAFGDDAEFIAASWQHFRPDVDHATALVGIRLDRVTKAYSNLTADALRRFHTRGIVSMDDFATLSMIRRTAPPGVTPAELARTLGVNAGSLSKRLDRLEAHGHIARHDHPTDKRTHTLQAASPEAIEFIDSIYQTVATAHARFFADLTPKQHDQLAQLLAPLARHV